jgi:putative ABC transport system permease protein
MDVHALNRLLQEGPVVSGAHLRVDPARMAELYPLLKNSPRVAGVAVKASALDSFRSTIMKHLLVMQTLNVIFACVIAFGVVYNNARISLSERSRELATLRVIGFTRAEISAILLGELGLVTLVAIPLGFLLGYVMIALMVITVNTELIRIPLVVDRSMFGFAATVIALATLASGMIVRRKLDHLDLVAVLKTKE